MDYIFNFFLHIDGISKDTFRLTFLDSQNDGTSQDYVFKLHCFSQESYDISRWGLKKAVLYYKDKPFRTGLLTQGRAHSKKHEGYFYKFALSSPISFFKTRGPNRVFVNQTPDQIINTVFETAGWKPSQYQWNVKKSLPSLPYVVQYHQADYDFVMSLLEEFNLNFSFNNQGILNISESLLEQNTIHHVKNHQHYYSFSTPESLGYDFEKISKAGLFTAKVEAPDLHSAFIDQEGFYYIKFNFDHTSELLQGSSPVPLLSPHFMHFPLRAGTDVAVRFIDGNMRQPVLIGVLPNNPAIPQEYIQKSYLGHELSLTPDAIKITHSNAENFIELAEDIAITANNGEINFKANKANNFYSQGDITQEIKQDQKINIKNNHSLKTQMGNIILQSARNISFSAENELNMDASLEIKLSGNNSQIVSKNIEINAQGVLEINNSQKLELFGQMITVEAQNSVEINTNGVGIMGLNGSIVINTPVLTVNALEISGIQMT